MWFRKKKEVKLPEKAVTLRQWLESNKDRIRETNIKIYAGLSSTYSGKEGVYELIDYGRGINDLFYGKIIDWLDHTVVDVINIVDGRKTEQKTEIFVFILR